MARTQCKRKRFRTLWRETLTKFEKGMIEAYTAGFLDADGSVALMKRRAGPDWRRTPEVGFFNCDRGILDKIAERWGGRVKPNTPKDVKHNVSFELRISGDAALMLLEDVLPYMMHIKKSERARLILRHYKNFTPRNGKYTKEQIEKKMWLSEAVMGIQMRGEGAW